MSLLTDLCTICHAAPPKYCCPRCSLRSCSLKCVTLHKSRSSCSGVRDRGAPRRRHELANPAVFDQDFNFLTGLERARERNSRENEERGIEAALHDLSTDSKLKPQSSGYLSKVDSKINHDKITVIKAPTGLLRHRNNHTRWVSTGQCIQWTLEWRLGDGPQRIVHIRESESLRKAFARLPSYFSTQLVKDPKVAASAYSESLSSTVSFYIHDLERRGPKTVLISIDRDDTIEQTLRGRTIVEFPTIYVFQSPQDIPDSFEVLPRPSTNGDTETNDQVSTRPNDPDTQKMSSTAPELEP